MNNQPDYYAILNVAPTATTREIARAYRRLLRIHHPDTRLPTDGEDSIKAAQKLHDIMEAYVVLADPVKRAAFDRGRSGRSSGTGMKQGTPVKVRFHQAPAPAADQGTAQKPLVFGPTRWSPSRGTAQGTSPGTTKGTSPRTGPGFPPKFPRRST
ncbi:J domain-containing protein [Paenarthrobacter sp. NPDC089322]|uniref:J domain-containing protein n=1 Tax=Paenarthrobacter sp. NPDC089322 TaxID=3155065 RepID=UPI003443AB96